MGLNAHKDPTIEQYVRVHKVYAEASYKISDLVRAQDTDLVVQALYQTCRYPKTQQDSSITKTKRNKCTRGIDKKEEAGKEMPI